MKVDWRVAAVACISITAMEIAALMTGIDGKCFGIAVAAVAGIGGFLIGNIFKNRSL